MEIIKNQISHAIENPLKVTDVVRRSKKYAILLENIHIEDVSLGHFVTLNCSGQKFLISRHLLDQYPKTLLGNEEKRRNFWDEGDQGKSTFSIIYFNSADTK